MEIETGHCWNQAQADMLDVPRNVPYGVSGFLTWLMLWFKLCVEPSRRQSRNAPIRAYQPNRYRRRLGNRVVSPIRNNRPYYSFVRRDMTPGQFTEWLAQYSGRGRVRVYRMPYWRKTVKGKAAPLGTEHEYWRDPPEFIGKRGSKLSCGIWVGHLWPGWRSLAIYVTDLTPEMASWVGICPCLERLPLSTRLGIVGLRGLEIWRNWAVAPIGWGEGK